MWRIYYDDGSTFDSTMGRPHEAPPEGFICAVGHNELGERYIMQGPPFYCYSVEHDQWWPIWNEAGLFDLLRRNQCYAFREGRTVTKSLFAEIMARADKDPDFPR